MGMVWIPEGPEGDAFIDELIRFPPASTTTTSTTAR
jgi:hypothetical protein